MADVITLNEITALGNNLGESVDNLSQKIDSAKLLTQEVKDIAQTAATRDVVVDYVKKSSPEFPKSKNAAVYIEDFTYTQEYETIIDLKNIFFLPTNSEGDTPKVEIYFNLQVGTMAELLINDSISEFVKNSNHETPYIYIPPWEKISNFRVRVKRATGLSGNLVGATGVYEYANSSILYYCGW